MSEPTDRSEHPQHMRTRLLDAAEALYASEGSPALTNRRIAAAALTTTQSIYTHFGNREDLVAEMYRRAVSGTQEVLDRALTQASPEGEHSNEMVIELLKNMARNYRAYCLEYPGRFRLIRSGSGDRATPKAAADLRDQLLRTLAAFGPSFDLLDETSFGRRALLTVAAVHGFILAELEVLVTSEHDPDDLFDDLVHRCLVP